MITRALGYARAAARLTEAGRGRVTEHLLAYGNAVGENAPELLRHVVVQRGGKTKFGTRRPASALWSMHGETGPLSKIDRGLSQQATDVAALIAAAREDGAVVNARKLVELSDAEPGVLRVAAYAPIVVNDEAFGVAGALVRTPAPRPEAPTGMWLLALLIAALGFVGLTALPDRTWLVLGASVVVATLAVTWWTSEQYATAERAHLERRAADWRAIQGHADTRESVALAAPLAGVVTWSDRSELRIVRGPAGVEVPLHADFQGVLTPSLDVSTAGFALLCLLFVAFLTPRLGALFEGMVTQPSAYAYTAPAIVGLLVLVIFPFVTGVGLSFYRYDSDGNTYTFTFLSNFVEILNPPEGSSVNFWWTVGVTILWTFSNVFLHVAIGLALALVLNRPSLRGRKIYRTLLILPWAVPNYITALMWRAMFEEHGAVNTILGGLGVGSVAWFGADFWSNFIPCLVANVWLGFPFMMVVCLGALQSIPSGLYEAAGLDGATRWQQFKMITLPLIKPALLPAVILGTIWTFNMFNIIYLVSGGAGGTEILITEAYDAFNVDKRFGYAAAYAVLIFFVLLSYTLVTNRITKATEGALG